MKWALDFLSSRFPTWTKSQKKNVNILRTERGLIEANKTNFFERQESDFKWSICLSWNKLWSILSIIKIKDKSFSTKAITSLFESKVDVYIYILTWLAFDCSKNKQQGPSRGSLVIE